MIYVAYCIAVVSFVAGGVYLIMHGHWIIGLICISCAGGISIKTGTGDETMKKHWFKLVCNAFDFHTGANPFLTESYLMYTDDSKHAENSAREHIQHRVDEEWGKTETPCDIIIRVDDLGEQVPENILLGYL